MDNKKNYEKNRISKIYNRYSGTFTISLIMIFAILVITIVSSFSNTTVANEPKEFVKNSAEAYFYNKDYEKAIEGYKELQSKKKWPIYNMKIAEIYSVQGKYEESNRIIEDSVIKRYNLFDEHGKKEYEDLDNEFCNLVVFTLFMNGEYDKALDYGQVFMSENKDNYQLKRTMFAIYLAKGDKESAEEIINTYDVDADSAYELALYAKMRLTMEDWKGGVEILRKAWYIDNDDIKIYDVISEMAEYDSEKLIHVLTELIKEDPDEVSYKVLLAKCYSLDKNYSSKAIKLLEEIGNENLGKVMINSIKSDIYRNSGDDKKAEEFIENAISNSKNSYTGYYIKAENYYREGKYEKAFEACKSAIIEKNNFCEAYGELMPKILSSLSNNGDAEPYYRTALYYEPCNYNIMINASDYYITNSIDKNEETSDFYLNLASLMKKNDDSLYYNIALLQIENGDKYKAQELLEKCISINGDNDDYHRLLGNIYYDQQSYEEAIKEYRKAYSLDENNIETLNNAACYYIMIEKDIPRGFINIESAYKGITDETEAEVKDIITKNYNKIKDINEKYQKNNGNIKNIPTVELIQ